MKIISLPRKSGKTTAVIKESAKTRKYILVINKQQAQSIATIAQKSGYDIPFPVTLDEIMNNKGPYIKEVIVDEAGVVLEHLIQKRITMLTITEDDVK